MDRFVPESFGGEIVIKMASSEIDWERIKVFGFENIENFWCKTRFKFLEQSLDFIRVQMIKNAIECKLLFFSSELKIL